MNTQITNNFGANIPPVIAFGKLNATPKPDAFERAIYDPVTQKTEFFCGSSKKGRTMCEKKVGGSFLLGYKYATRKDDAEDR
jgi:hypothetical protein|tara:strand:+ start:615 stop:860 length:246 start_codon:yes stop_codon:yes gene_type:complete